MGTPGAGLGQEHREQDGDTGAGRGHRSRAGPPGYLCSQQGRGTNGDDCGARPAPLGDPAGGGCPVAGAGAESPAPTAPARAPPPRADADPVPVLAGDEPQPGARARRQGPAVPREEPFPRKIPSPGRGAGISAAGARAPAGQRFPAAGNGVRTRSFPRPAGRILPRSRGWAPRDLGSAGQG